ncbi:MAG: CBS domain-containing protein [Methanomicrobiales archaeon]
MRIPTPEEIRTKREMLGLRQTEVARRAGLSQSMIARIEAGSVDPRVSTLSKILDVLATAERSCITAADVMHAPVWSVRPDDPLGKAISIMEDREVSQIPVIEEGMPVGCISETAIIDVMERGDVGKKREIRVKEYMEAGFPTVPPHTPLDSVVALLHQHHAVVVLECGEVKGVITKHDLLHLLL